MTTHSPFTIDPDLLGLVDNVAIVFGGGGAGMGRSHCLLLAKAGCHVVVADIDAEAAQETARQVESAGRSALAIEMDATHPDEVDAAVRAAVQRFGRLDVAVNTVGRSAAYGPFLDIDPDAWDKTFEYTMKATSYCARAAALAMIGSGSPGRIINVASVNGLTPAAGNASLGAAKAGVIHLTTTLAVEFAKWGIRVNCIAPGQHEIAEGRPLADIAAERGADAVYRFDELRNAPVMRRLGNSWETAGIAVFFASKLSNYVTGTTVISDGGLHLTLNRPPRDGIPEAVSALGAQPLFE